jgi:hypothetical protein
MGLDTEAQPMTFALAFIVVLSATVALFVVLWREVE